MKYYNEDNSGMAQGAGRRAQGAGRGNNSEEINLSSEANATLSDSSCTPPEGPNTAGYNVSRTPRDSDNQQRVSISIITYNRANVLKKCLESLAKLTADKQLYEIIVVNNNCTDNTSEVCQNFAAANPDTQFRHVTESKQGYAFARNKAVAEAKYELLAFIDDDATVEPNYVDTIIKAFEDYPEYNVGGGKVIIVFEDGFQPKFLSKYLNPFSAVDLGNKKSEFSSRFGVKFPPGCNVFFRKEIFEKYGDFDNTPLRGEDKHIFHKLKEGGERVLYMPEVVVYHHQEKERCKYGTLMNLGYTNGKSIALWLADKGAKRRRAMLVEKVFNFLVSIGLGAFYFVTFRPAKTKYLVGYMYHVTKGYIDYCRLKE